MNHQPNQTFRKQYGVYYTPDYIIQEIIQYTLGKSCYQKKEELQILDLFEIQPKAFLSKKYSSTLRNQWINSLLLYQDFLLSLKILDPACGTGLFLQAAFDFLYLELNSIQTLIEAFNLPQSNKINGKSNIPKLIIKNLYGIDIDKLAITQFQHILQSKLSDTISYYKMVEIIQHNIQHGHALINPSTNRDLNNQDDSSWMLRYPEVFEQGGFNFILGNPPYVNITNICKEELSYYQNHYFSATYGRYDLYVLFIEQSIKHLKQGGKLGFIVPDKLCYHKYAKNCREILLDHCSIETIIDCSQCKIFADAVVDTIILIATKEKKFNHTIKILSKGSNFDHQKEHSLGQDTFNHLPWKMFRTSLEQSVWDLINNIYEQSLLLKEIAYISFGMQPGKLNRFIFKNNSQISIQDYHGKEYRRYIRGRNIRRYLLLYNQEILLYTPKKWHRPAFPELFINEKIIISRISKYPRAIIDNEQYYTNETSVIALPYYLLKGMEETLLYKRKIQLQNKQIEQSQQFNLYYLLGLINSKLLSFIFLHYLSNGISIFPDSIRQFPIYPAAPNQQHPIIHRVKQIIKEKLKLKYELENHIKSNPELLKGKSNQAILNIFLKHIYSATSISNPSQANQAKKIGKPFEMLTADFCQTLLRRVNKIKRIDKEIDQYVYNLYSLTNGEILRIENDVPDFEIF